MILIVKKMIKVKLWILRNQKDKDNKKNLIKTGK